METKISGKEHVQRQESSSLSVAEYCRQNGIAANSFYNWKSKARKESGFVRVSPKSDKIELELSNGIQICVEADKLQAVLGALNAL